MIKTEIVRNGLHDLTSSTRSQLDETKYCNNDVAPILLRERNWRASYILSRWIGMNVCISTYLIASSAVTIDLRWWIALILVAVGNLIILVPIQLNSHVGTQYEIFYLAYCRLSFGLKRAQIFSVVRSAIGAGWTGVLVWVGGESLHLAMKLIIPGLSTLASGKWGCFGIFLLMNISIAYVGSDALKNSECYSSPVLEVVCGTLLVFGGYATHQSGHTFMDALTVITDPTNFNLGQTLIACLVANITFYSTWALNIPDLSRHAKNQKSQFWGQMFGMPTSMIVIAFLGIDVTGAYSIIDTIGILCAAIFAAFGISLATLTTNVTTNILPPANGIANLWPKKLTYKKGVLITGFITTVMQPWELVADPSGYIYDRLRTYGALTGTIASIFIYDYFILRKQSIALDDLYKERETRYWYKKGFCVRALAAWVCSIILPVLGKFVPALSTLSLYGWLLSFALGFVFYPSFGLGRKIGWLVRKKKIWLNSLPMTATQWIAT